MATKYHQNRGWPINAIMATTTTTANDNGPTMPYSVSQLHCPDEARHLRQYQFNDGYFLFIPVDSLGTGIQPCALHKLQNGIAHQSAGLTKLPEPGTR